MRVMSLVAVLLLLSSAAFGQAMDGNLVGGVRDGSGGALSQAKVELQNVATGVTYTTSSSEIGAYRLNNLPPGSYKLTASLAGFATTTMENVVVEANRQSTVNLTLELGTVTTVVEVRAAGATIDTTTANVTTSFTSRQALQLPITGIGTGTTNLGVINLSLLGAGVTSSGGVGYGTGPSIGGQRPTNNNFMVDGVDNNNRSVTGPQANPSNEAVAEFSLQQNQFSVEFGQSTGGQFNTILRSGGNELHGSIYEYFQNRNLNAVDQSFKRQGIRDNPRLDQNRLGATVGGPILKNRWFYFGNFEYNPLGQASTSPGAVFAPTAEGIRRIEGLSGISRRNLDVFKQFVPVAGSQFESRAVPVAGASIPVGILNLAGPSFANSYNYAISSDYNISDRDQLRARYVYNRTGTLETRVPLPEFFTPIKLSFHLASLSEFHTFAPNLTNEFRLGYTRRVDDRPVGNQGFPGLDAFPNLQFNDLSLIIGPFGSYPQSSRNNTIQLVNNVNWIRGRHSIKFGYDGRQVNISSFFVQRQRGDYIYTTLERYLQDITPEFGQRSVGGFPFVGNLISHYTFFKDEIQLRDNLTVNLGLRYEFVDVPTGAKQQSLNALSSVPGVLELRSPQPTKKDFAPRVGVAWSPGRQGKTSIRAGFGLGYDQVYQNLGINSLPPQFFTTIDAHIDRPGQSSFLGSGAIAGTVAPITSPARARLLTSSFIPDQLRPYSLQWNLGVQRVMQNDYTVEIRYLGSRGVHLPFQVQMNRPAGVVSAERSLPTFLQRPSQAELDRLPLTLNDLPLGAARSPLVQAGFTSTITTFLPQGNSSYHGLAAQVTRRFARGLQYTGAYTWSHNIDDSTAALFSTILTPRRPQDFENLRPERSSSALDHRHRFTMSWVYETPWMKTGRAWWEKNLIGNWLFSGTYTSETGTWATPRSAVDSNRNGDNAGDRAIINPAGDPRRGSAVTALTNSSRAIVGYLANDSSARYIVAGAGAFPTAGRNTVRLPMINNFDVGLGKRFNIGETKLVEFRAEFYNAFNHPQYTAGFPNVANLRNRTAAAETSMLIPGNAIFLRPDLAFQSNSRGGQLTLRFQF